MTSRNRERYTLIALLLVGCVAFFGGIGWGLPSRQIDPALFGAADRAWSGAEIAAAGGSWTPDPRRAADADTDPVAAQGNHATWLNPTPREQAAIIRRFRLFSYQPDEMVTFMSLAGMRGGRFDPRMYQYGGLWIYPVGGLLKIASHPYVNLVTVKPDLNYYLDHPDEFGRFYVVARFYSGLWGLVGIWAVFRLATRLSDKLMVPAAAAACFLLMPIVINGTHEAKPHLAGAVLILLTALAATKYVETGLRRWWILAGVAAGAAAAMVLSAVIAFLILILMAVLRPGSWRDRARVVVGAGVIGVAAYFSTNPYVLINLVRDPAVVRENLSALGKAKALVGQASDTGAIPNAYRLIVDGASVVGGVFGWVAILIVAIDRRWRSGNSRARTVAVLLGAPAAVVLLQFVLLAKGKPGEFGRFAILPDVGLMLLAVAVVFSAKVSRAWTGPVFATLVLLVGLQGASYWMGFWADARRGGTTRDVAAARLEDLWNRGARTLGVRAEPAPYNLPPVDVTKWKLLLIRPDGTVGDGDAWPDVIVFPVDDVQPSGAVAGTPYVRSTVLGRRPWGRARISWADKPFEIRVKSELPGAAGQP